MPVSDMSRPMATAIFGPEFRDVDTVRLTQAFAEQVERVLGRNDYEPEECKTTTVLLPFETCYYDHTDGQMLVRRTHQGLLIGRRAAPSRVLKPEYALKLVHQTEGKDNLEILSVPATLDPRKDCSRLLARTDFGDKVAMPVRPGKVSDLIGGADVYRDGILLPADLTLYVSNSTNKLDFKI